MFDEEMIRHLHSGCALLVGSVDAAGRPHAGRGHGLTLLQQDPPQVRLLVEDDDVRTVANLQVGARVAICTGDVRTLASLQLKGRVLRTEAATAADVAKQVQYSTDFTNDIHETDGHHLDTLRRWAGRPVRACVVEIDELFDQTPGPSAGARVEGSSL